MLILARTLTIWNRGYPLPDSLYLPDNQQDICTGIFCFCLSACLSFAAEQREHCSQDIKTDFTLMGLNYQLYIKGNIYQPDQHLLSQLLLPPTSCPPEICQYLLTHPLQFWTLTDAVCYLLTSLMVCKEMQIGIDRKPEKATERFTGQENTFFPFLIHIVVHWAVM